MEDKELKDDILSQLSKEREQVLQVKPAEWRPGGEILGQQQQIKMPTAAGQMA